LRAKSQHFGDPVADDFPQPYERSPYFFPADWGEGHFIGIVRVLDRVAALARLADVTPHTLRRTFASAAGDLGFSELTIAALLGHASRGVTQRYVHIDEALRMAADKIAGETAGILDDSAGRSRLVGRQLVASEPDLEHV
jgi:integrase